MPLHIKKIQVDPMGYVRQVQSDAWKKRPVVLRYRAYADELRLKAGQFDLPASFAVTFRIAMPKSWSKKKKREMLGKPHQSRPDNSNLLKALEDILCTEDSHIWQTYSRKIWSDVGEIQIIEMDEFFLRVNDGELISDAG